MAEGNGIERDAPLKDTLDSEYRQILRIIKPFIATINNNNYLSQYRVWLEKLSITGNAEKIVRNEYLIELARQIQCKELSPPFTLNPPDGMLKPIQNYFYRYENEYDNVMEEEEEEFSKQNVCNRWSKDTEKDWSYNETTELNHNERLKMPKSLQRCSILKKAETLKNDTENISPTLPGVSKSSKNLQTSLVKPRSAKTIGVIHEDCCEVVPEDSSWCDESTGSRASLTRDFHGGGDESVAKGHFHEKIDGLIEEINVLRASSRNSDSQRKMPVVYEADECTSKEENEVDWKKRAEILQTKLMQSHAQNLELNSVVVNLQKKNNVLETTKEQEKQQYQNILFEEHKNELQKIKKIHTERAKQMESSFRTKLQEKEKSLAAKLHEVEEQHATWIRETLKRHQSELKERENEIARLEGIVKKQCLRLANEITALKAQIEEASQQSVDNDDRVAFLQRCITKMDRLFQKSEREHCKQIEKLKQEMENREKAIQIQMQTQRAELVARCSAEKQTELDTLVLKLEERYKQMLNLQQTQHIVSKSKYEQTINELKKIIGNYKINNHC